MGYQTRRGGLSALEGLTPPWCFHAGCKANRIVGGEINGDSHGALDTIDRMHR